MLKETHGEDAKENSQMPPCFDKCPCDKTHPKMQGLIVEPSRELMVLGVWQKNKKCTVKNLN